MRCAACNTIARYGGFDAIKDPRHHGDIPPDEIDPRQGDVSNTSEGKIKQHPGDDAPRFLGISQPI